MFVGDLGAHFEKLLLANDDDQSILTYRDLLDNLARDFLDNLANDFFSPNCSFAKAVSICFSIFLQSGSFLKPITPFPSLTC